MLKKHRIKIINALMCFAIAIIFTQMTPNKTTCNVAKAEETEKTDFKGASGKMKDLTWSITAGGHLTIKGTGDYIKGSTTVEQIPDWSRYSNYIKTAEVDVQNITCTNNMFQGCDNLTSINLKSLNTDKVTEMMYMFHDCSSLTNLDLSSFKTGNVTTMHAMFDDCRSLTNLDLSNFETDNLTETWYMFHGCSSLTSLNLSSFKTDNVTDMQYMFYDCDCLTNLDLSSFKTDNVTNMSAMFYDCSSLTNLDLSSFKTDKVTDMTYMFNGCIRLTNLDLSSFKTDNVTTMEDMFNGCHHLTNLDLSSFKTDNVTDMSGMFNECYYLTSLDLSSFKTDNVTDMSGMFSECTRLTNLDLSNFNINKIEGNKFFLVKNLSFLERLSFFANSSRAFELPLYNDPFADSDDNPLSSDDYYWVNDSLETVTGTAIGVAKKVSYFRLKKGETPTIPAPIEYSIIYNLDGGVNNKDNPATYNVTQLVTFKAPSKDGFTFDGWYKDSEFKQAVSSIDVGTTGVIILYAKWKEDAKKPNVIPTTKPVQTQQPEQTQSPAISGGGIPIVFGSTSGNDGLSSSSSPSNSSSPSSSSSPSNSSSPSSSSSPSNSSNPSSSNTPSNNTSMPTSSNAPSDANDNKVIDPITGAVTETVTLPDGTKTIKEVFTETKDNTKTVTETIKASNVNTTIVKVVNYDANDNIIDARATVYTGGSDINSNLSAKTVIPESYLSGLKDIGIQSIDICIEKPTVDIVKNTTGTKMVVKVEMPSVDGVSVDMVILTKESIASAMESDKKLVVKIVNEDHEKSYTVTIPQHELKKMSDDINISVRTAKVSGIDESKKNGIDTILSSNGIGEDNSYTVSVSKNNIQGGIKVTVPVLLPSVKAGDNVYVYCYNEKTGKLEEIANSKRMVLNDKTAGIEINSEKDYIVTDKELSGKNVVTLLDKCKVKFNKTTVKKGKTLKIKTNLPQELSIKKSLKASVPYAKQTVVVKYKSFDTSIAKVSKNGTVKAKGKGKVKITVQIKLADGKVKKVKKNITVK